MASPDEFQVLIIGGGITGLLIAHGLRKAGISFSTFEAEPLNHYRPREWSMGIHWSLPFLEKLLPADLLARISDAQSDPSLPVEEDFVPMINGLNGRVIKNIAVPRSLRVSRRKMRAFCSQGLDIQYNKTLRNIEYGSDGSGVTANFTDGTSVMGSMIIGADGPASAVRHLLLGSEAALTPLALNFNYVNVCYHDAFKARFVRSRHPALSITLHPEVTCLIIAQDMPDPRKPENWLFGVMVSWLGKPDADSDHAARLAQVKERGKYLPEPAKSAIEWLPDDCKVPMNSVSYWIPVPWDGHGGRVTLAGDAAHPMSPHRGQGLNHAICDVYNLVNAIKKAVRGEAELEDVVETYAEDSRKRGGDEVKASRQTAYDLLNWNQIMQTPLMAEGIDREDLRSRVERASGASKL